MGERLKGLWKNVRIGFWNRIITCAVVVTGVSVFNAFDYSSLGLVGLVAAFVATGFMLLFYSPAYFNRLRLVFRNKATECPLPQEILALAEKMGVKITKMKTIPKIFNACTNGRCLFLGEELLRRFNMEQIKATAAHEFGHIKGKHIIIQYLCMLPILTYVWLIWNSVPLIILYLGSFAYATIAMVPIEWELERRADLAAKKYVGKEAIRSALHALEEGERINEPSETHPPISKRLKWIDETP